MPANDRGALEVLELRPDGGGGTWARVIFESPILHRPKLSNTVDITLHLPATDSLSMADCMEMARDKALELLSEISGRVRGV